MFSHVRVNLEIFGAVDCKYPVSGMGIQHKSTLTNLLNTRQAHKTTYKLEFLAHILSIMHNNLAKSLNSIQYIGVFDTELLEGVEIQGRI